MENTAKKFAKGQEAFWVTGSADQNGQGHYAVTPIRIMSWGTRQGTGIRLDTAKYTRCRFYTDSHHVFATPEESKAYIESVWLEDAKRRIEGSLRCERSALPHVLPKFQPKVLANIASLEAAVPTLTIKWLQKEI